jgi:hypothetical protein
MPDNDFTPALHEAMLVRLRAAQAKKVMPMLGPLLDAWERIPNYVRSDLCEECPTLVGHLDKLAAAMENS